MKKKLFSILILIASQTSLAGRPLITDDAGVIGKKELQIESWLFLDERSIQHWLVPTFGISDFLEFSASGVQGLALLNNQQNIYGVSGPIVQAKIALRDIQPDGSPGFAFAAGAMPPFGRGSFRTTEWEYFYYLAATSNVTGNDKTLLHVNIGRQTRRQFNNNVPALLWGIAAEVKTADTTYCFLEVANGDVYALIPGLASHLGLRHDVNSQLQLDGTIGSGLSGEPRLPFWGTLGFKYVTDLVF